ncbi:hypothetical protein HPB52_012328 [Rhipicephalus sanguineus]|uniref:CCHC-type domain-containing protein n=1 Tax=Rhipicephalus sanguineus TaxID=34632 RepID=A0A9D4YPF8_RHISA|nr:hypothetical protein HPB52_012328 [Rhipicephalus sanguineus]
MEVVEREEISQEEACDPGWKVAYGRRPGKSRGAYSSTQDGENTRGRRWNGGRTAAPRDAIRRVTVASRIPPLPRDTFRIVVRPRDGLNVNKISRIRFEQALAMAAALAPAEIEEDTMCPNGVQNIFVVCTPHEKNADAYARVQQIRLGEGTFGVAAYLAPPENTCKGIIRGVDVEVTEAQLRARIVNHRNPSALEARRMKNTTAVVVLFEGMRVPNYVACGASIFRCTLYRRHTEVCYECGELGHRADVCPNPGSKWCRTCGKRSPTEDHRCDPKCTLCGGPHPTAAKECRDKFQVPYIVRRRRRQRRRRAEQLQEFHRSRDSTNVSTAGGRSRSRTPALRERSTERSRSRTPAARKYDATRGRSRSRGCSASSVRIQEEPTWADRVKGTTKREQQRPKEVTRSASPEHGSRSHVDALLKEVKALREEVRRLKAIKANPKPCEIEANNQSPEAVEQVPRVGLTKAKRKAPLPEEESDSEASEGEAQQKKMLEELLRISRENQESVKLLLQRVTVLEEKAAIRAKAKVRTQSKTTNHSEDAPGAEQGMVM